MTVYKRIRWHLWIKTKSGCKGIHCCWVVSGLEKGTEIHKGGMWVNNHDKYTQWEKNLQWDNNSLFAWFNFIILKLLSKKKFVYWCLDTCNFSELPYWWFVYDCIWFVHTLLCLWDKWDLSPLLLSLCLQFL